MFKKLFFSHILFLTILWDPALTGEILKICHLGPTVGASLPVVHAQDAVFHPGFLLAGNQFNKKNKFGKKIEFIMTPISQDYMAIPNSIIWSHKRGCNIVVGLVSSRDARLAGPFLKKYNIIGYSSTANDVSLSEYFPYFLSASTSSVTAVDHFFKSVKNDKIVVVGKRGDYYSSQYLKVMLDHKIEFITILDHDNMLPPFDHDKLLSLAAKEHVVVFYTTYPFDSIPSLKQLSDASVRDKIRIVGTHPWMETHVFGKLDHVFKRLNEYLVLSPWNPETNRPAYQQFVKDFQNSFWVSPDYNSVFDYDVMSMIIEAFVKCGKDRISSCLSSRRQYKGVTGLYRYNGKTSHAIRAEYLLKRSTKQFN